jgi:hypothetical protein
LGDIFLEANTPAGIPPWQQSIIRPMSSTEIIHSEDAFLDELHKLLTKGNYTLMSERLMQDASHSSLHFIIISISSFVLQITDMLLQVTFWTSTWSWTKARLLII